VRSTVQGCNGSTAFTPWVLWTVNAVGQVIAKQPCAAAVFMSALIPAPDDGSKPAIESRTFG
jgi:hypothetical protein